MYYVIGRKEYVSYFAEFVMGEMIAIETPDYVKRSEIEQLIRDLNYEMVAIGRMDITNDFIQILNIQEFTEKYFYLRENNRLMSGSLKEIDKYCDAIELFYKNVQKG